MADEFMKAALYGIKTFNKKAKEKIGMMKLIELLNEWQEKELGKAGAKYLMFDGINKVFRLNNGCSLCQELVLSHRFCFVKWLVENDKIDRDKILKENGLFRKYFYDLEYVKNYDRLVMRLSVEDEPINFLISILK